MQFETSTKWPDELIALEQTKTAFLLKIDQLLNKETAYKCFLEKDELTIPYNDKIVLLKVLTPEGYGFSFRILTERDEVLYLRAIENATDKQKKTVTDVYLRFNQKYMGSTKHHRAVATLVNHYPFYSPVVRLFKRWLDSQLLLCHFPDELVELIALKVFVDPAPFSAPSSVASGFLRILHFLSTWNWKEEPLILDLAKEFDDDSNKGNYIDKISDKLTVQSYQVMYNNFNKLRQEDPNAIRIQYFVASKEDPSGKLWTSHRISLPIASRLTALSKAAISLLLKHQQHNGAISNKVLKLIFTPALKDYDFVVRLNVPTDFSIASGILPDNKFKNLVQTSSEFSEDVTTTVDPTQRYFEELVSRYNNVMVLSTNKFIGLSDNV
ncbi:unnamed protein product [Ambrosiozyma monospora]|uniref:Unnamed protein product n=1 Tax=Ambrosiozyma monospora TaxID=43982 RepID=A0ACB5T4Z8_AMBMO|nr:unnamed protein product [Ambrosiozyma monospora]